MRASSRNRLSRFFGPLVRWIFLGGLWFVALSIAWVLLYRVIDPPVTWLTARDFLSGVSVSRETPSLEELGRNLPYAVIAAEDGRFCQHHGFDFTAINKAMASNVRGKKIRGGSTLSQQVAKNAFLWPHRSWTRKALEAWFTVLIEAMWPKARIMEVYLGLAEWDEGIYGGEAAARHHFGKSAKNLSRKEAARLAAILPSPKKWSAAQPGPFVRKKTRRILKGMSAVAANYGQCLKL